MNYAQPFRVSVVEIPLLLDAIVQNLSHDDIWSCAQVCKLWRGIFELLQWKHVSLVHKDGSPFFQSLLGVERTRIIRHSGMIRKLKVNFEDVHMGRLKCSKLETLIFTLGQDKWKMADWDSLGVDASDDADSDEGAAGGNVYNDDGNNIALAWEGVDQDMMSMGEDEATLEAATAEDMNLDTELSGDASWRADEGDEDDEDTSSNLVVAMEGVARTENLTVIPDQPRTNSRWLGGAWSLLDKTPSLLTLHLPLLQYTPDLRSRLFHYFDNVSNIHTNEVRHLAHLTLEYYNSAGVDEISVLRHLPESLLSVEFRIHESHYSFSNLTRAGHNNDRFIKALHDSKELYPLRSLSLTRITLYVDKLHDFGGSEVLLWFLRQCPQLRDLSLMSLPAKSHCESLFQTLVRYCPKLERLCLNMKMDKKPPHRLSQVQKVTTTFESQVFSMLAPLALKRLSIDIGNDAENVTLQTLEQWSKDSLEELQLVRSGKMAESEFDKIRSTYPKLNRITYWKGPQNSAPEVNED